jgi:hypothetical protein
MASKQTAPTNEWIEIRNRAGELLFKLDPERWLIQVKPKGEAVELVDLRRYLVCRKRLARQPHGRSL